MQPIRALVTDLDDTLLTEDHRMTDRTAAVLSRLVRQGITVVLASGRSGASMRPFVRRVGTPCPYIAYNGAQIVDPAADKVLLAREVSLDLAREALLWLEARGVYAQYYAGDDWFYAHPSQIARDYGVSSGIPGVAVGTLSAHIQGPTPKVLAIAEAGRVAELLGEARAAFGRKLAVTTSKPQFLEITSPLATKGEAVAALAEMLGMTPETTVCAGDSLNDLPMLAWSRLPVAVANARPEVKAVAWRVAGDGRRDGLALLMDELIPEVT